MKKLFFIPAIIFFAGLFGGCYYDNEEDLYPQSSQCDTTNVTYETKIAPIMENNCNSCHNQVSANAGVFTDNYQDLKTIAENGQLWGAVNHEPGYTPMPKDAEQLPDCDLKKIRIWIDNGTPRN
ncbi:MAG: hypothetical protein K9J27_00835 [Bacteroidales bacterium]|nr:hypothetical protein [Bacteroidales bacterium]MCF8332508.1 hypothetical protein [Bacteroidales bacterium]